MGLIMKYFVLKPKSKIHQDPYAKASRKAIKVYANMIEKENPELASDLRAWAYLESIYDIELKNPDLDRS